MTTTSHFLGSTAHWMAGIRAMESAGEDALFCDPWASALAGPEGRQWIEGRSPESVAPIVLRTRFFDDLLQRITRENAIHQVVLPAAGLDTRAFRLSWPAGTHLYELDQPEVLAYKDEVLAAAGARPNCIRRTIPADLAGPWQESLLAAGFDREQPSGWLLEGFLFYLPSETIVHLLDLVARLAAPESWLGFDVMNSATLTSPLTRDWVDMQARLGAPWIGTLDDPVGFMAARGWTATLSQAGQPDANHGRWPFPVVPTTMPDFPHNWFVVAEKRG
jgi:methyltransferase (TIGR00027 family)